MNIMNESLDSTCPNCGGFRYGLGNGMMDKCINCGFQECPMCGDELSNGCCLSCHGHMSLESFHSIGECPECTDLRKTLEKLNNEMYKL